MPRKCKALVLALGAVFMIGAMGAVAAQASESAALTLQETEKAGVYKTYAGEKGVVVANDDGVVKFTRGTRTVECKEATFDAGKLSDGVTSITTGKPEFKQCTGPLGFEAKVEMDECHFHFDFIGEANEEEEGGDTFTALSSILCEGEATATITVLNEAKETLCQYSLPQEGNQGLSGVDLTNLGAGGPTPEDWIRADVQIEGITSERTVGSTFLCGSAEDNAGILEGTWELKAIEEGTGKLLGLTVSTH